MEIYVKRRAPNTSGMLVVAFVSGLAIGFLVCFAFFGLKGKPKETKPPVVEQTAVAVPAPAASTAAEVAPAVTEPAASSAAPLEPAPPASSDATTPAPPAPAFWPGRFLFVAVPGATLNDKTAVFLKEVHPGGVVLEDDNLVDAAQTTELVRKIKEAAGQGTGVGDLPLIAVEQEGGKYNKLKLKPKEAPSAAELGKKNDPDAAREAGRKAANAALTRGIGILLAPVLDVIPADMPKGGMAGRVFSADRAVVARIGLAYAQGINDGGAISVCKYFPGIGMPKKTGAVDFRSIDMDAKSLGQYLFPFQEFVNQGFAGILVGHVALPLVDTTSPNRLAVFSPVILNEMLRDNFSFKLVALADDVAAQKSLPAEKAVVEALGAGCDAVLFLDRDLEKVKGACAAIDKAVADGVLKKDKLDQSVQRLDEWKIRLAVAKPRTEEQPKPEAKAADAPAEATKAPMEKADSPVPVEAKGVAEPDTQPGNNAQSNHSTGTDSSETTVYIVKKGDRAEKIATKYGINVRKLKKLNHLEDADELIAGQELLVPKLP